MKRFVNLIYLTVSIIILFESCDPKKTLTNEDKDTIQTLPTKSEDHSSKWKRMDEVNDSISLELSQKFPNALITDSINDSYSIFFQKALEKSNNLIFIKEANITDIREFKGNYIVTTYSYFPKIVTHFFLDSNLAEEVLSKISKGNSYESCCLVAKIRNFVPVTTDLISKIDDFSLTPIEDNISEDDVKDYIHLDFDSEFSPTYFMSGSILEIKIY